MSGTVNVKGVRFKIIGSVSVKHKLVVVRYEGSTSKVNVILEAPEF